MARTHFCQKWGLEFVVSTNQRLQYTLCENLICLGTRTTVSTTFLWLSLQQEPSRPIWKFQTTQPVNSVLSMCEYHGKMSRNHSFQSMPIFGCKLEHCPWATRVFIHYPALSIAKATSLRDARIVANIHCDTELLWHPMQELSWSVLDSVGRVGGLASEGLRIVVPSGAVN